MLRGEKPRFFRFCCSRCGRKFERKSTGGLEPWSCGPMCPGTMQKMRTNLEIKNERAKAELAAYDKALRER